MRQENCGLVENRCLTHLLVPGATTEGRSCSGLPRKQPSKTERLPFYWLIRVKDEYLQVSLDHSRPWKPSPRHKVKGIRTLKRARIQLERARILYPEARLVRFYFSRAKKEMERRALVLRTLEGDYDRDLVARMLETARIMRLIKSFVLEEGRIVIGGTIEDRVERVVRAVSHQVRRG